VTHTGVRILGFRVKSVWGERLLFLGLEFGVSYGLGVILVWVGCMEVGCRVYSVWCME
jgi:hypothetical protein